MIIHSSVLIKKKGDINAARRAEQHPTAVCDQAGAQYAQKMTIMEEGVEK